MGDNSSAHVATEYDDKIIATIPFYDSFHEATIDLIHSTQKSVDKWLDTGCGTGTLCVKAKSLFANTEFTLSDPSAQMLKIAREKLESSGKILFKLADTQNLTYPDEYFDVITAIQCHHYLDRPGRVQSTKNCFRMLKQDGIFVVFENIRSLSERGQEIGLKRWENYQINMGKTYHEAAEHIKRFDKEYFPISIIDHLRLLNETGFKTVEILWASYLQAGFYAIK